MEAQSLVALPIVLAVELSPGESPSRLTLSRDDAAELAGHVASDLHALVPQVAQARLALAGALFDAVELLRPGFPVWATLDELARRVPRGHLENVVAFGSHEGHMPAQPLEPDPTYADGPMRFLPLSLLVPDSLAETLSEQLEVELVGRGEAGERTSDSLIRQLGVSLEHVRYFSRNDVLALTCVQYEHVNLAPLWTLLEAGLLTPFRDESTLSSRGLALRYIDGAIEAQSPSAWLATQSSEPRQRAHELAGIIFELRQYAALLGAHGLPLRLAGEATEILDGAALESLAQTVSDAEPAQLYAHEAAGLGVIAVTVAQRGANGASIALAHGYPLAPDSLGPLVTLLAARHGIAPDLHAMGQVMLDNDGKLAGPAAVLH